MFGLILAQSNPATPKPIKIHAFFGLALGLFGFVVFGLYISQFFNPSLAKAFAMCTFFYSGIGLPVWSLWLGVNFKHIDFTPHHQYVVFQG